MHADWTEWECGAVAGVQAEAMTVGALAGSVLVDGHCNITGGMTSSLAGLLDVGTEGGLPWLGPLPVSTAKAGRRWSTSNAVRGHLAGPVVGKAEHNLAIQRRYAMAWDGTHWVPRRAPSAPSHRAAKRARVIAEERLGSAGHR